MATTDRITLKAWFTRGLKPLASQFAAWLDSYWHKDDTIPQSSVENLTQALNSKANSAELSNYATKADLGNISFDPTTINTALATKVDKVTGKGLSTEDYSTEEKTKLAGLNNFDATAINSALANKADKVDGKGLSTEDYSNAEKTKLAGLSNYDDTAIKGGVPVAGDNLYKLYTGIQTLNGIVASNDFNLDTVQEIVTFIKNNKDVIDSISTTKVNIADIVDNLLAVDTNRPLSANQGKVLKGLIDALQTAVGNALTIGETATTAFRGDQGKTAYLHSQVAHDKALIGLPNVDNTSDANKPVSAAQQTALDLKLNKALTQSKAWVGNAFGIAEEKEVVSEWVSGLPTNGSQKEKDNPFFSRMNAGSGVIVECKLAGRIDISNIDLNQEIQITTGGRAYKVLSAYVVYTGSGTIAYSTQPTLCIGNNANRNNIVAVTNISTISGLAITTLSVIPLASMQTSDLYVKTTAGVTTGQTCKISLYLMIDFL